VSILNGIQPGPLSDYLAAAARFGVGDDGLIQRFQMAVWPDAPATWRNVDRWPHKDAKHTAFAAMQGLEQIDLEAVGAEQDGDDLPFLRFDPDAQAAFTEWRADLETRLRSGEEHPALEAHLAKYHSLVPSLALICHLADGGAGPVPESEVLRAAAWADYLAGHARRIFSRVTHEQVEAARKLAAKLMNSELASPFALRDVYRPQWAGLLDCRAAQAAVEVLLDHGWLAEEVRPTAGRAKTLYRLNPHVIGGDGERG
jgi:putative DNA primase/helicase